MDWKEKKEEPRKCTTPNSQFPTPNASNEFWEVGVGSWRLELTPAFYRWLIRLATQAAPNPLSILTTVTPLAHEFSMPSSAASPSKLAP